MRKYSLKKLLKELDLLVGHKAYIIQLKGGIENLTFYVKKTKVEYVIRIYLSKDREEIMNEINFLNSLSSTFSNYSKPIKIIEDKYLFSVCGFISCAFEYCDGSHPNYELMSNDMMYQLGYKVGELHSHNPNFSYRTLWNKDETLVYSKALYSIFKDTKYRKMIKLSQKIQKLEQFLITDKKCIIHGDISFQNMILSNNKFYFIDFDDSTYCASELELAIIIRNIFIMSQNIDKNTKIDMSRIKYIIQGYREQTQYTPKNLGYWTLFASLRYIVLMFDKSLVNPYYPSFNNLNYAIYKKSKKYVKYLNDITHTLEH
jgi:Ser/Thr protein kinase RdoA (MazF antagonist)